MDEMLFVATGRWVAGIDRLTGRPAWKRKLPRWFSSGPATILAAGELVFAGRGGYVYCLHAGTGEVLWERGIGSGTDTVLMAIAGQPSDQGGAAAAHARAAAAAAAAT